MANNIQVEVAFATRANQTLVTVKVPLETTVEQAIQASGIQNVHPEIDLSINEVGIWSKKCSLSTKLQNQDRVEIYRKITIDPKEARKLRVANSKVTPK